MSTPDENDIPTPQTPEGALPAAPDDAIADQPETAQPAEELKAETVAPADEGALSHEDLLSAFSFAPSWARTSSENYTQQQSRVRESRPRDRDARRDGDRRPAFRREGGAPRPNRNFSDVDRKPKPFAGGDRSERYDRPHHAAPHYARVEEEAPSMPLEVRVLPEQKALGAVMRRIQTTHRAYPLRDLAALFLDNPNSCLLRAEPLKNENISLFQCKICGLPALTEDEIRTHVLNVHFEEFFETETVECAPPTGVFNCVAKCGLSGEWIGPPNHHSYNIRLQEIMREKYPDMPESAYRTRIEMMRDAESIEAWRASCTTKKVYRLKDEAVTVNPETNEEQKAPAVEREAAEMRFKREILDKQVASVKHFVCTVSVAKKTPSPQLYAMLRTAVQKERRFPASLFYALRGAFRHRKFNLFRVIESKGQEFVSIRTYAKLDAEHAVADLQNAIKYVEANPCCSRHDLMAALAQDAAPERAQAIAQEVAWLFEKGHLIEYYNGLLAVPGDFPPFRLTQAEKEARAAVREGRAPAANALKDEHLTAPPPVAEPVAETVTPAEPVAEIPATEEAAEPEPVKAEAAEAVEPAAPEALEATAEAAPTEAAPEEPTEPRPAE